MTQQDVLKFLQKNKGKKYTSEEISRELKTGKGSIADNLKKLRKTGEIRVDFKNSYLGGNLYYCIK